MKFILTAIFFVLTVVYLSACAPIYNTQYDYIPPRSATGKMCTSQCIQNKSMCEQMCQMKNDMCRTQAHQDALYQYQIYQSSRKTSKHRIKKSINDFDTSYRCNNAYCDCQPGYNACYSACGGQILEHQVCVAFCDKG